MFKNSFENKDVDSQLETIRYERLKKDIINLVVDTGRYEYLTKFTYLDQASVNDRLMELTEDYLKSIEKSIERMTN